MQNDALKNLQSMAVLRMSDQAIYDARQVIADLIIDCQDENRKLAQDFANLPVVGLRRVYLDSVTDRLLSVTRP